MVKLEPIAAELYGHLFENRRTGIERDLFWNIRIDFRPVEIAGETWTPSFACEWLRWPVSKISDLDGMGIDTVEQPDLVEAALYLFAAHHPVSVERLTIRSEFTGGHRLDGKIKVEIANGDEKLVAEVDLSCGLAFTGIVIAPDNIDPKPMTAHAVSSALAAFFSLEDLEQPEFDRFRYVLKRTTV